MAIDRSVSTTAGSREFSLPSSGIAPDFAAGLLRDLGVRTFRLSPSHPQRERHPHLEWARCGAMALSGLPEGPPLLAPASLASAAQGALLALRALSGASWGGGELDAASLLGEHAAVLGHRRRGSTSPGGNCRMIEAADGWLAVNLARASDRGMIPAWLETESISGSTDDVWSQLELRLASRRTGALLSRARLMGLPVAPVSEAEPGPGDVGRWLQLTRAGANGAGRARRGPLVLDLSSLWAGPLCAHLLGLAGARVIKLESLERPDGARSGPIDFFDLLNANKASVALEITSKRGRRVLECLLERVDIVIESSRPRALAQLGIVAEEWLARRPGLTWLSITGYGRAEPEAGWVAFGDDAAAAAGLAWATSRFNEGLHGGSLPPLFCGDAIADPLTGLYAAPAALASWLSCESRLLDISLCGVVRHILHDTRSSWRTGMPGAGELLSVESDDARDWCVRIGDEIESVVQPRARAVGARAGALGADTDRVLSSLGIEGLAG